MLNENVGTPWQCLMSCIVPEHLQYSVAESFWGLLGPAIRLDKMQRDFRKQYYSQIGMHNDEPKFKAELAKKVMNVPLIKDMVLRMGLPLSCRAAVWRLQLSVLPPNSETWPAVIQGVLCRALLCSAEAVRALQSTRRWPMFYPGYTPEAGDCRDCCALHGRREEPSDVQL